MKAQKGYALLEVSAPPTSSSSHGEAQCCNIKDSTESLAVDLLVWLSYMCSRTNVIERALLDIEPCPMYRAIAIKLEARPLQLYRLTSASYFEVFLQVCLGR